MSLWWSLGTHSYLLLPLTLAQSYRIFSSRRHLFRRKNKIHKQSFSHLLSFILLSLSLSLTRSNTNPTHWSWKETSADKVSISIKKGRGEKEHPPSNTVYAGWSCVLWWQSIYTLEEGNWYWDLSNIAANEALPPGKLGKSWWTAEEIFMKAFPKDVKQNTNKNMQSTAYTHRIIIKPILQGAEEHLKYSCMFKYLSRMHIISAEHFLENNKGGVAVSSNKLKCSSIQFTTT